MVDWDIVGAVIRDDERHTASLLRIVHRNEGAFFLHDRIGSALHFVWISVSLTEKMVIVLEIFKSPAHQSWPAKLQ